MRMGSWAAVGVMVFGGASSQVFSVEPASVGGARAMERTEKQSVVTIHMARDTESAGYEKKSLDGGSSVFVASAVAFRGADISVSASNDMVTALSVKSGANAAVAGGKLAVFADGKFIAVALSSAPSDSVIHMMNLGVSQTQALLKFLPYAPVAAAGPRISIRIADRQVSPGGVVVAEAFLEGIRDLRAYQIAVDATSEDGASLKIDALSVDESRPEYPFYGTKAVQASDVHRGRVVAALYTGGITLEKPMYGGTFRFKVPADAKGSVTLQVRSNFDTQIRNGSGGAVAFQVGEPIKVLVMTPVQSTAK